MIGTTERVRSRYRGCGVGKKREKVERKGGRDKGKEEKGPRVIASPDGLLNASYVPRPMQSMENTALRQTEPLPEGTQSLPDEKGGWHSSGPEETSAAGTQTGAHTLLVLGGAAQR